MPDIIDVEALTTAAADAATREDAAGAAALLRQALDLQAATLGPDHRDLAPTLNNLALMLERQGEASEAERCYRRAYDIASGSGGPNDPLVRISRANLEDFLRASGRAALDDAMSGAETDATRASEAAVVEPAAPATATPPARQAPRPPAPAAPAPVVRSAVTAGRPPVAQVTERRRPVGLLATGVVLAVAIGAWWLLPADEPPASPPVAAVSSTPEPSGASGPTPDAGPAAVAAPAPAREEPAPPPVTPPAAPPPAAAAAPRPSPVAVDAGAVTADASICVTLSRTGGAWRCEPPDAAANPDALYYYTRVKSTRDIVVRHRWTHEGTVVQTVSLRIAANPRAGFRTFSRQTLRARGPGRWEVALIGPDGATLDVQRFERR